MCGLAGYYLRKPDPRIAYAMAILQVEMDCRGGHSYGYFADGEVVKGLGDWHDHIPAGTFADKRVVMGHTRYATVGAKTVENAHPFEIGDIIGAHNGSVSNYKDMNTKYNRNFDVDSMHIIAHISEDLPLKELTGHGAVTYLRRSDPLWRPHFGRVSMGGDLEVAELYEKPGDHKGEDSIGFVWASTSKPLEAALRVAGFGFMKRYIRGEKLHWVGDEEGKPLELYFDDKYDFALGARTYVHTTGFTPSTMTPVKDSRSEKESAEDWYNRMMEGYPGHTSTKGKMDSAGLWEDKGFGKHKKKKQKGTLRNLAYSYEMTTKGREATMMVSGKCWGCENIGLVAYDTEMKEVICRVCASIIDSLEQDLVGESVMKVDKADLKSYIAQLVAEEEAEEEELFAQEYGYTQEYGTVGARIPFETPRDPDMPPAGVMEGVL